MIIGLGHRSGHGKDTFAKMMRDYIYLLKPHVHVKIIPWAWPGKQIAHTMYGHLGLREPEFYETPEGRELRNVKLPKINLTPVEIWVVFMTNAVRNNVWEYTWISLQQETAKKYDVVISPDTRNPNEVKVCDITVKIHNPRIPNREGHSIDDLLAGYAYWDHEVINDGTLSELSIKAKDLVDKIL